MPTYNNGAGYFLYVNDISEVYGYNVPAGGTMFFMNRNQPILYLKSVNMFNQQNVTEYSLIEKVVSTPEIQNQGQVQSQQSNPLQQPVQQNQSEYVTRGELSSIIAETIRNELKNNRPYYGKNKKEE